MPNIPPQPFPQFANTLNFIVNTDGPYSDPALRHGVFSSASYVDMFLVVCPVGELFFLFLFNVITLLDTLIFFLWGNGGVGTDDAANSH